MFKFSEMPVEKCIDEKSGTESTPPIVICISFLILKFFIKNLNSLGLRECGPWRVAQQFWFTLLTRCKQNQGRSDLLWFHSHHKH